MVLKLTGALMALFAVALLYMGGKLALAGGSPAYLAIGAAVLVTAVLLYLRKKAALTLYGLLMWAILAWIIAEVGFDKWQWIPRGDLFALLGLWLAMPWVVGPLYPDGQRRVHLFLSATLAVMLALVIGLMFYDPYPVEGTLAGSATVERKPGSDGEDWAAYGGTGEGQRFSSLKQINRENAHQLSVAWEYHTGDLRDPAKDAREYTFEATPLKVNDRVYLCTAHNEIHALNPETGALAWKYAPEKDRSYLQQHQTCRGVSYFAAPASTGTAEQCAKRIFSATADARLIALDADTGERCPGFGDAGVVDLSANMGKLRPHALMQTAAPLVAGGLVVVGGSVMDNGYEQGNPSGVIRAYDAISGRLVWNFDPATPDDTTPLAPGKTYAQDTPVAWGTLSADLNNGLVFVPFGNASPDELGAKRNPDSAAEAVRDALVALDLRTGALKWRFQTANHDLWDRDIPSQPSLLDLGPDGNRQPAIVVPTKVGNLFVLNRLTGQPIVPVQQVQVSTEGGVAGERFAATQPVSALNFIPGALKEASMWGLTRTV